MPTLFTRIVRGELPGRFVWRDPQCVAFLSIGPLQRGHTLVVPIREVDHWLDLPPDEAAHLMIVSQKIGQAMQAAFSPVKVGLMIAGLEVPHVHLHLVPIHELRDLDFARAARNPDPAQLDAAAEQIRAELRKAGHAQVSG
jgi:histidine triad (HIT) family protein